MMRMRRTLLAMLLVLLLGSCAKHESEPMMSATTTPTSESHDSTGEEGAEASKPATAPAQRMVIKTADVTLESDDPEAAGQKAQSIAEKSGGFVVQSNVQQWNQNANNVSMTLRVPANQFDAILGELRKLGDAKSESIGGQDITEEFMDLQAQLRNQRALETRFLELLGQAQSVAETIEVERELARVRTEIERMEGRTKYLKDRVDLSTINLTINPTPTLSGSSTTIGSEISEALADSGAIVAVVIGGLIRMTAALLPILVLLSIFGFVIRALYRWRKAGKK